MKRIKYNIIQILALFFILLLNWSCVKQDFEEITELELDRVLAPTQFRAEVINRTSLRVKWGAVEGVETYEFELSKDSMVYQDIIYSEILTETEIELDSLEYLTMYTVRVKANSNSDKYKDSKANIATFTSGGIIRPVLEKYTEGRNVTIEWDVVGIDLTKLIFISSNDTIEFNVLADDNTNGNKKCTGLEPNTSYNIFAFADTTLFGTESFKTQSTNYLTPNDDVAGAIRSADIQDTIILDSDTFKLPSSLSITKPIYIKGRSYENKTYIKFDNVSPTTCITITSSNAGYVKFENIEFDGYTADSSSLNNYLITPNNVQLDSIIMRNCTVKYLQRSAIRTKNVTNTSLNVVVDNCTFFKVSLSNNDFIDFRDFELNSVTLRNSTLDSCAITRTVIRVDTYTSNINIDNCTFYNTGLGSSSFIRATDGSTITITDNVITNTDCSAYFNELLPTDGRTKNISYNNYFNATSLSNETQDEKFSINPEFLDPANGDFTIPEGNEVNTRNLGDPRWIQ